MKNLLNRKKEKGFTLIEALVAISILLIAVATPMTIAQKGLMDADISKDEATASFLAQDAIESVKNIRDNTALAAEADNAIPATPSTWLSDLQNCVQNYCNINTLTLQTYPDNGPSNPVSTDPSPMEIVRDGTSGQFLHFGVEERPSAYPLTVVSNSIFSRYITVIPNPSGLNPNEAEVNVKVSWQSSSGPQNIILSDFIYNYSPNL